MIESKGDIYEISNYSNNPLVVKFKTPLKGQNDIEGISYDESTNSLLLSIKEKNLDKAGKKNSQKNIYAFFF